MKKGRVRRLAPSIPFFGASGAGLVALGRVERLALAVTVDIENMTTMLPLGPHIEIQRPGPIVPVVPRDLIRAVAILKSVSPNRPRPHGGQDFSVPGNGDPIRGHVHNVALADLATGAIAIISLG